MSELDYVAVLRLYNGDEVVALLTGHTEETIQVDHPFILKYDNSTGSVTMLPYCLWTDEITFTFNNDKIVYVVSCSDRIALKYLDLVDDINHKESIKNTSELEQSLNKLEAFINGEEPEETYPAPSLVIEGNDTKH